MKYEGDYKGNWKVNLMVKDSLYKVVSFNCLEKAKRWAKREVKKFSSDPIRDLIRVEFELFRPIFIDKEFSSPARFLAPVIIRNLFPPSCSKIVFATFKLLIIFSHEPLSGCTRSKY